MYTIQANEKGSRQIVISDEHLQTIQQYQLFRNLIDSSGIVSESVLQKLRLTVRALLLSEEGEAEPLLSLSRDVVFHPHMKAFALHRLMLLYTEWENQKAKSQTE